MNRVIFQVRKFVIRREVQPKGEGKKPYTKAPRIQRLVTPQRLQHKRHRIALKRRRAEASKDAAVCNPRKSCRQTSILTCIHNRPSTPASSTSVLARRRPSRSRSRSAELLPCASRRIGRSSGLVCRHGQGRRHFSRVVTIEGLSKGFLCTATLAFKPSPSICGSGPKRVRESLVHSIKRKCHVLFSIS